MAEKLYKWNDEDQVVDETRKVKKIWDNVIPEMYPYVLKFETFGVAWVTHIKQMGPYTLTEKDLKFKAVATISVQPLKDIGFRKEDGPLNYKKFKEAYGEEYDYELRNLMRDLLKHVNIDVSHFDFEGDLSYNLVEDKEL